MPRTAADGLTDGYVVDPFSAEQLARAHDRFTSVQVRETLEGHPVPDAIRLLARFAKESEPYPELKHWALVNQMGFYRPREKRLDPATEYERYLNYLCVKDSENRARTGRRLTTPQREDLTRRFYAPAYRAEMAKLAAESYPDLTERRQSESTQGTARNAVHKGTSARHGDEHGEPGRDVA